VYFTLYKYIFATLFNAVLYVSASNQWSTDDICVC
jgi:hypothetical protein